MSLQVGAFCYATPVDAGRAACAQFSPITSVDGSGNVITLSCASSDATTGALNLQKIVTAPGGAQTVSTVVELPSYPDCVQGDYIAAVEVVIPGLLVCWVLWFTGRSIMRFLGWSRGENA